MTLNKPFSQACENNKDPILQIISEVFTRPSTIWEIGSGTGQHACHFAKHMPHIIWQPTDREENLEGIGLWVAEANLVNLNMPKRLDVNELIWPCQSIEGLFTANTLHIMSWTEVERFFSRLGDYLKEEAKVCIYGPFNYHGVYTSESNAAFDRWLKERDPRSGIRDKEAVELAAGAYRIRLIQDCPMPANNRLLIFEKYVAEEGN